MSRSPLSDCYDGRSVALYSTWVMCRPFHLLVDCGEGAATVLQSRVFGVRTLALTHGHLDHLSGVPSFLNIRRGGMGDHSAPLTILHPARDGFAQLMQAFVEASLPGLDFPLTWVPLEAGDRLPLDEQRVLEAFATDHVAGYLTLGYRVLEQRRRLRPEWRGRTQAEIRAAVAESGREALSETYEHPVVVFGGDGMTPAASLLRDTDLAFLEATFVNPADRGPKVHATVEEAVQAAAEAGVRELVLQHVSTRYSDAETASAIAQAVARHGFAGPVHLLGVGGLESLPARP